jgi:hypothetical protein
MAERKGAASEPRITRRYNLSRSQREFVTSQMAPSFIEQQNRNISALDKIASGEAEAAVFTPDGARMMATQFRAALRMAEEITLVLTEGNTSGDSDTE